MAVVHDNGAVVDGALENFLPTAVSKFVIPVNLPAGIRSEFREAEVCASVGAWRAASALIRSVLEKTLRENGYSNGSLAQRIDEVAADRVITGARQRRAHDEIRVLGNDVLHDPWRLVTEAEYEDAHHYAQRILEDFYDHRAEVEALLRTARRIP
jgi:hypothetical protein